MYLLLEKSEALNCFKKFKKLVEKEAEVSIKCLRTDRGGEFTSHEFMFFAKSMASRGSSLLHTRHNKMASPKERIEQ